MNNKKKDWRERELFLIGLFQGLPLPLGYDFDNAKNQIQDLFKEVEQNAKKEMAEEIVDYLSKISPSIAENLDIPNDIANGAQLLILNIKSKYLNKE